MCDSLELFNFTANDLIIFQLKPNYVTDNKNKKVAVQLNIKTYEKIEEILENYSLYHLMKAKPREKPLNLTEAKEYYKNLKRKKVVQQIQ